MAVYDSAKTREVAKRMNQLIDTINTEVRPCVRESMTHTDAFRGRTADRMEEQLHELNRSLLDFVNEMELLQHHVNLYADSMERADEQLAEILNGRIG